MTHMPQRRSLSSILPILFAGGAIVVAAAAGCGYIEKTPAPKAGAGGNAGAAGQTANVLPPKDPKPLDLAYIPAEAVLAVVLDPYQLRKSPNLADAKAESFAPQILAQTGINIDKVAQVMLVGWLEDNGPPVAYGFIVRFNEPYSKEAILANLLPDGQAAKDGDREYLVAKPPGSLATYFADEKSLLIAPEAALKKMLAARDVQSPLLTELRRQNDAAAALAMLMLEPIRGKIQGLMFLGVIPKPTEPLDGLLKAVQHVSLVELKLEVTPQLAVRARIRAKNEGSAVETEKIVNQMLDRAKAMLDEASTGKGKSQEQGQAMRVIRLVLNRFFEALKQHREKELLAYDAEGAGVQAQIALFGPQIVDGYHRDRDRTLKSQTFDKLKQIGLAMLAYEAANGRLPAPAVCSADGKPLLSWRVQLLPYLDEQSQALHKEFHLDEPWDSEHNKKLLARMPAVYQTPGRPRDGKTGYLVPLAETTVFYGKDGVRLAEITDGTSNTVALLQVAPENAVEWTRPDDLAFDADNPMAGLGGLQLSGEVLGLREGVPALFADGAARMISWGMKPKEMAAMFTRSGGEAPPKVAPKGL